MEDLFFPIFGRKDTTNIMVFRFFEKICYYNFLELILRDREILRFQLQTMYLRKFLV